MSLKDAKNQCPALLFRMLGAKYLRWLGAMVLLEVHPKLNFLRGPVVTLGAGKWLLPRVSSEMDPQIIFPREHFGAEGAVEKLLVGMVLLDVTLVIPLQLAKEAAKGALELVGAQLARTTGANGPLWGLFGGRERRARMLSAEELFYSSHFGHHLSRQKEESTVSCLSKKSVD